MNNLDGEDGPDLTHGSNGIPAIPDLNLFGFDFGEPHVLFGIPLGRFSNYYFLLLVLLGLVILVFTRLNNSRIGRGWVAIREDEKAAEAMGVNVFGLKLFAFAGGAFLAGVAGSVKAHSGRLGHPGPVRVPGVGVPAGRDRARRHGHRARRADRRDPAQADAGEAAVRQRVPAADLRAAAGPHDAVPARGPDANQRRQLEFHEEDEELAERIDEEIQETGTMKGGDTDDRHEHARPAASAVGRGCPSWWPRTSPCGSAA